MTQAVSRRPVIAQAARLDPRPVLVRFVVDKVALRQAFFRAFRFPLSVFVFYVKLTVYQIMQFSASLYCVSLPWSKYSRQHPVPPLTT
jgi:hypothetical protein